MKHEINAFTLAIKNLNSLKKFYADVLGWRLVSETNNVAMLKLNTTVLTLCSGSISPGYSKISHYYQKNKGLYFIINLSSAKEVDEKFSNIEAAGAHIVKAPSQTSLGGYSGLITDPEDNRWEICYNPAAYAA